MAADPIVHFLNLPPSSPPRVILGIGPMEVTPGTIETALRERLAQVYTHPDGGSEAADVVRRRLREAARELLEATRQGAARRREGRRTVAVPSVAPAAPQAGPERGAAPPPSLASVLTDFDRSVLAVLVGCGGWNVQSRARLVALAAAHGVTVTGLMRVINGLSEYAKHGGPRLDVAEIASGRKRPLARPAVEAGPDLVDRIAPELRKGDPQSTAKLALFFSVLTLIAVIVGVNVLFFPGGSTEVPSIEALPDAPEPAEQGARIGDAGPHRPAAARTVPLAMDVFPTFAGKTLPPGAGRAADKCPQLPEEFEALARRITVAAEPSETVYRNFAAACSEAGAGWVLIDEKTRRDIEDAVQEVLYAASDTPSVTDRLLAALSPPTGRLAEPIDLWRGAWMAGMLGKIGSSTVLAPAVVERARAQLDRVIEGARRGWDRGQVDFVTAAGAWLDQRLALLVDRADLDPATYDFWECWIGAQRRLGRGERLEIALLDAAEAVLATPTDLARRGTELAVLGRLVTMLDFESSPTVKQRVRRWFEDTERITSRDLWVLTSLLARRELAPWFSEDLVVADNADWMFRRRLADRVSQRWPAAADERRDLAEVTGVAIDPELARRWRDVMAGAVERSTGPTPDALLARLVETSRINEAAAALLAGAPHTTEDLLEELVEPEPAAPAGAPGGNRANRGLTPPGAGRGPGGNLPRRGQPIGTDGEWAVAWKEAGRDTDEKLRLIATLRSGAGTDLGPIDAEVFVEIVYRGTPQDVRDTAQDILVELFMAGPQVAMQLLDHFAGVPESQSLSETISRLTGRVLPAVHSSEWEADARLALCDFALALNLNVPERIDAAVDALVHSYERRVELVTRLAGAGSVTRPQDAARKLADALWHEAEASRSGVLPEFGSLAELERRRTLRRELATGPVQLFVAEQLAIMDLLRYITVAEQPAIAGQCALLIAETANERAGLGDVLAQAVAVERTIARLWGLRLGVTTWKPGGES